METPRDRAGEVGTDRCAELRNVVNTRCGIANEARSTHSASIARTRELRRLVVSAEHEQETAQAAADPQLRKEEKARARVLYGGVTLWAANPEYLKDIVYRMRFDEASARYAEFGPFLVSYVCTPAEMLKHCQVSV